MSSKSAFRLTVIKLIAFIAVAVFFTIVVVATLLDVNLGKSKSLHAIFTNASGLQPSNTVRIAGVEVGKVNGITLRNGQADVSFTVSSSEPVTTTTGAEIHFENLLGQEFLALVPGRSAGTPLKSGATIPTSQTKPALDLTALFNGFQPLFAALSPNQVNQLTGSIIQVFQGEAGSVSTLVSQTASLTNNLAARQQVINQVLDNLSSLVGTVGTHDQQLGSLIDSFDQLVGGLAAQRGQIASTIDGVGTLASGLSNVVSQSQPALNQDIQGLAGATASLAANQQSLDGVIQSFPAFVNTINKVTSSGNYLSVYVCNLTLNTVGQLNVSLSALLPAPQFPAPVTLPSGPIGDQTQHTASCR